MIIYSVTVSVNKPRANEWIKWMTREHIPEVMETGFFFDFLLTEVLEAPENNQSRTFNVQYHAQSREDYDHYLAGPAEALREKHRLAFGEDSVAFRTLLRPISKLHP